MMDGKWVRGLIGRVLFTAVRKKAIAADMSWDEVLNAALRAWVRETPESTERGRPTTTG